jgi:Flp pilus assembly protein TadG
MGKFNRRRLDERGWILFRKPGASRSEWAKGQALVEFALVASVFFLVLFAVMDYGWLMFSQMNVQQAVDDGGRYASTGRGGGTGNGTRISAIINHIQGQISVPGVNVAQNVSICSTPPAGSPTRCYNSGSGVGNITAAGGPNYTVTLSLTTTLPLMTPLIGTLFPAGGYTFVSSTTYVNEQFNQEDTD